MQTLFQKLAGDFSDSRQTVAQESRAYRAYARVRYTDARDESRQIVHFFVKLSYNKSVSCEKQLGYRIIVIIITERWLIMAKKQTTVNNETKAQKAPNCSVNFVVVAEFDKVMTKHKLTRESKVGSIVLALYKEFGTNLNPNVTAKQIRDYKGDGCKCSSGCISWYKAHYNAEQNKFVSSKKNGTKKQELLEKLYAIKELKTVQHLLPAIPMTKLQELATNYNLI